MSGKLLITYLNPLKKERAIENSDSPLLKLLITNQLTICSLETDRLV
jgi:hypothetical protein